MARPKPVLEQPPARAAVKPLARVSQSGLQDIEKLEDRLWEAADNLRANSKLTSSEYCMPVNAMATVGRSTMLGDLHITAQSRPSRRSWNVPTRGIGQAPTRCSSHRQRR